MSSELTTIRAEALSKLYWLSPRAERHDTLRDQLVHWSRRAWRRAAGRGQREFWALRDVSFEASAGQVVGIVGRNGAGKSTLLKVLSRIVEPSSGRALLWGQVASMLEVGTGFHPELTGRENIYLNGALLGIRRADIARDFDAIVAFSEIDAHLDVPVKRYSSGMYMRLAFAVAAHLQSDILLVDEVLSVGDLAFQKKCLGRVGEVVREGRTVLFVSHNMASVLTLCSTGLMLEHGRVALFDTAEAVVRRYLASSAAGSTAVIDTVRDDSPMALRTASICDASGSPTTSVDFDLPFVVSVEFEVTTTVAELSVWVRLVNEYGVNVLFSWIIFQKRCPPGRYTAEALVSGQALTPGRYFLDVGAEHYRVQVYHEAPACLSFDIANTTTEFEGRSADWGVILPRLDWRIHRQHWTEPVHDTVAAS